MKPIEPKTPPEQTQMITAAIFEILKEHGLLTVSDSWERVNVSVSPLLRVVFHVSIYTWWLFNFEVSFEWPKCFYSSDSYFNSKGHLFDLFSFFNLILPLGGEVGLRGLTSKRHMKIVLRWMRKRQKLRIICNNVGPQKQFLYTTWFTKPNITRRRPASESSRPKLPWGHERLVKQTLYIFSRLLNFNVKELEGVTSRVPLQHPNLFELTSSGHRYCQFLLLSMHITSWLHVRMPIVLKAFPLFNIIWWNFDMEFGAFCCEPPR